MKKLFFTVILALATSGASLTPSTPPKKIKTPNALKTILATRSKSLFGSLLGSLKNGIQYIKSFFWSTATKEQESTAEQALANVQQDLALITQEQQYTDSSEKIEEINSPAVQKEKTEESRLIITSLMQHVKNLDASIAKLPSSEWPIWQEKQTVILAPAELALKKALQQNIKNSWQKNGAAILQLATQATAMGIASAIGMFAYQIAQMGTGNMEQLDTNRLMVTFLTSASANLLTTAGLLLSNTPAARTVLTATETNILSQSVFAPSMQSRSYQLQTPLFRGVIENVILSEAIAVVDTMLTQNGEIAHAIKNIQLKPLLIGRAITPTSNALVAAVLPKIQHIIHDERFALALTEVGWIYFQSAVIGGILWSAGVGFAGTSMITSINQSVLLGMAQGTLANLAALINKTTPGAILSIASVPLSEQIVTIAGGTIATTQQAAITGVLQVITTQATNFMMDESEKYGGLFETLQKGKNALGAAISSRWSSIWGDIADVFATIQEIEPLPI